MIGAFLDHLETERNNSARTRNVRLGDVHSFFQYCALRHPEHAALIAARARDPRPSAARSAPSRSCTSDEVQALLDAPDRTTWAGRRDHALLLTAVQTGLRVSEVLGLTRADTQLGTGAHVRDVRQRPKGKSRAAHEGDRHRAQGLDARVRRGADRARCSRPAPGDRSPATRSNAASPNTSQTARRTVPNSSVKADHDARPPAHRRDDAAERRDRHLDDRAVVGPRTGAHDARVSPRRPRTQAAQRSTGLRLHPAVPAATDRPIPCSPSSTVSDLVAAPDTAGMPASVPGITDSWAVVLLARTRCARSAGLA